MLCRSYTDCRNYNFDSQHCLPKLCADETFVRVTTSAASVIIYYRKIEE